ncbi:MAG: hypothetical protein IKQ43_11185 [Treponema sp.]|nr:hypothetical protein [Treponema sp.]
MKRFVTLFIAVLLFIMPFTLMSCESMDWEAFGRASCNALQDVSDALKEQARMNRERAKILCPDIYFY